MNFDDFEDDFEGASTSAPPKPGAKIDAKQLADADYVFVVKKVEPKDTNAGPLVTFTLEIASPGAFDGCSVERQYWLTKKDESGGRIKNAAVVKLLHDDLAKLGFDVDNWTKANGRPFSVELKRAAKVAVGMKFKGKKKQNGQYANLYVNERAKDDGKPAVVDKEFMDEFCADPFGGDEGGDPFADAGIPN